MVPPGFNYSSCMCSNSGNWPSCLHSWAWIAVSCLVLCNVLWKCIIKVSQKVQITTEDGCCMNVALEEYFHCHPEYFTAYHVDVSRGWINEGAFYFPKRTNKHITCSLEVTIPFPCLCDCTLKHGFWELHYNINNVSRGLYLGSALML